LDISDKARDFHFSTAPMATGLLTKPTTKSPQNNEAA